LNFASLNIKKFPPIKNFMKLFLKFFRKHISIFQKNMFFFKKMKFLFTSWGENQFLSKKKLFLSKTKSPLNCPFFKNGVVLFFPYRHNWWAPHIRYINSNICNIRNQDTHFFVFLFLYSWKIYSFVVSILFLFLYFISPNLCFISLWFVSIFCFGLYFKKNSCFCIPEKYTILSYLYFSCFYTLFLQTYVLFLSDLFQYFCFGLYFKKRFIYFWFRTYRGHRLLGPQFVSACGGLKA
jgi:hypothetical protein